MIDESPSQEGLFDCGENIYYSFVRPVSQKSIGSFYLKAIFDKLVHKK
jgi:hypothetical protein